MKVILMQDVAKLGRRFDIVEVADGRGLNFLIPKGLALPATAENLKNISAKKDKVSADREADDAAFQTAVTHLSDKQVVVVVEANAKGHMFQALKAESIVEALALMGVNVVSSAILIADPIKEIGAHEINLVHGTEKVTVSIEVTAK